MFSLLPVTPSWGATLSLVTSAKEIPRPLTCRSCCPAMVRWARWVQLTLPYGPEGWVLQINHTTRLPPSRTGVHTCPFSRHRELLFSARRVPVTPGAQAPVTPVTNRGFEWPDGGVHAASVSRRTVCNLPRENWREPIYIPPMDGKNKSSSLSLFLPKLNTVKWFNILMFSLMLLHTVL